MSIITRFTRIRLIAQKSVQYCLLRRRVELLTTPEIHILRLCLAVGVIRDGILG